LKRWHGRCAKCTRDLSRNRWDCDHIVALCNGGENRETNLRPLCVTPCHSDKTRADRRIKVKADRAQRKTYGIRKPRTITRWRNMRGEIVEAPRER
jgi:5-methylcytosine-specific restriction endonuclease McrA